MKGVIPRLQKDLIVLHNLKISLLGLSLLAVLSGCQTAQTKSDNITRIQIEEAHLSHLSEKAQVSLKIYSGTELVEEMEFSGLNRLPYIYTPTKALSGTRLRAEVSVSKAGEVLLTAKSPLVPQQVNPVVLQAQQSESLTESYWSAVDVVDRGIPPSVKTTLALRENGRISGFSGCNHYRGQYSQISRFVEIAEFETTNNICANPVMYHEGRYFRFLKSVDYYEIREGKLLLFMPESDLPIVFDRTDKAAVQLSMKKK
jgi:heat shock protein HslJ